MNTLLPCTAALAVAIAAVALPASAPVHASSNIQRCIAADGSEVYTDQACGRLGADALPLPSELMARIVEDRAAARRHDPLRGTVDAARPLDAGIPVGRRSPESGCAKSATQLAADLRGALALGDVNRVAESYHWAGMSAKAGGPVMDRLQDLSTKQVLDGRYYGSGGGGLSDAAASIASADGATDPGSAGFLELVVDGDQAQSVIDFEVYRYRGCYFVSF